MRGVDETPLHANPSNLGFGASIDRSFFAQQSPICSNQSESMEAMKDHDLEDAVFEELQSLQASLGRRAHARHTSNASLSPFEKLQLMYNEPIQGNELVCCIFLRIRFLFAYSFLGNIDQICRTGCFQGKANSAIPLSFTGSSPTSFER